MNKVFKLVGDLVPLKVAHDLMHLLIEGVGEDDEKVDSLLRSFFYMTHPFHLLILEQ
jgi:AP-4 complex subunit epsilon-1